ncbi:GntR family transcriptional regulator [Thermocrispum municipale]|jgi:DNA-binding GntR family transcriptional regulator|uniref:GntR family transcriptional regulator n=1 Tax=Thermocrispum municipale TaxID=37926 RepID=UPI00040A3233|nr:GntR family transcriptional regulator [Thermocrispum municipale]
MTIRLATQSVGEALVASLRERILTEDIPAGVPVTEASVVEAYSVARQTAKAAIERLVAEGLLERTTHKSARVPVLDERQVKDLYFARGVIESRCYELLAEEGKVSSDAQTAHDSFAASAEGDDLPSIVYEDVRFHRALVDSLDSPRLSRAHELIINEMRLCLAQVQSHQLLDPAEIAREHQAILDAIRDKDPRQAADAGLAHLAHAESKLLAHMAAGKA